MKKQDEGFTLIELLIVIVILGILAAVVVFAVGGITDRADQNACEIDRRTVKTAYEAYIAEYPGSDPSTGDLATANWLETASTNYEINTAGEVVAITDGPCD